MCGAGIAGERAGNCRGTWMAMAAMSGWSRTAGYDLVHMPVAHTPDERVMAVAPR